MTGRSSGGGERPVPSFEKNMKTTSDFNWTGLLLLVGLFGCTDRLQEATSSASGTDTDDEVGVDETASEGEGEGSGSGNTSSESDAEDTTADTTTDTTSDTTDTTTDTTDTTTTTDTTDTTDTADTDTTDTTDTGIEGCADVCGTPGCGDCPDPPMIDGGGYLIDATETTVAEYAEFLAIEFDPSVLGPRCDWKIGFEPSSWDEQLQGDPARPVTRIDWCDAENYCRWSGRHLCGTIGGTPAMLGDAENPNGEWYDACSGGTNLLYPYGAIYDATACNGLDLANNDAVTVASLALCQGGLPGLFDMSGNVWEWTNACDANPQLQAPTQECQRRGGSFNSDSSLLDCESESTRVRSNRGGNTGVRCCDSP
jgi:sulfatase modifying factor 1